MPLADIINPKDQAEYWNAWYPQVPYTATPEQQLQLLRLKEMEEQSLRTLDTEKTSQGGVEAQNQQAMQAPMSVQDGVAQMAPVQAVAPTPAGQGVLDVPRNTGLMDRLGPIPVIGGQQATPPSLSFPGASMGAPSIPPGIGFSGMQQAPQGGAAPHTQQVSPLPSLSFPGASMGGGSQQALDRGAAMQQAQPVGQPMPAKGGRQTSVIIEPAPAPEAPPEKKVGWWKNTLEAMKDPTVSGPLMTFFGALSAPLAPWETPGSRIARASSLMSMHKNMLTENMRRQPMDREMEQLKLEEAQLGVENKRTDVRKGKVEADVAEALKDTAVQKAMADLAKARSENDLRKLQVAEQALQNTLLRKYGDDERASVTFARLKRVDYENRMATVAEREVSAKEKAAATGDKVWDRQKNVYRAVAGNALRQFKAAYPNGTRAQFETWLSEESLVNPSLAEAGVAMGIMRGEGEDLYGQLSETPAPKRLDFNTGKPVQ